MNLVWSLAAQSDMQRIQHWYACRSSQLQADEMIIRIADRAEQLCTFPELGAELQDRRYPGVREILRNPFRIRYRVVDNTIEIIAVIHSARTE